MKTLVGIVTPYAWDESDQVCEVSLSATDDEEYVIENSGRFLDLLQKPIRAVGMVKSGRNASVRPSRSTKRYISSAS